MLTRPTGQATSTTARGSSDSAPSYRADIDGLRAVAVASVILFHLHLPGFGGGFVGVDIFFVISGYLITRLIETEIKRHQFYFSAFYLRRVRRLAPALVAISIPTVVAGFLLLYPEDMRSFASSLSLQFAAVQNVSFLADGEYFRGSETKPLLHTWSLAVEEQFYLVWPLGLWLTRRIPRSPRLLFFVTLMFASFALNVVLLRISPKASFFLLPPRAWELGAGALVALLQADGGALSAPFTRSLRIVLAVLGATAVALSIGTLGAIPVNTQFPGFAALLPVLGTALIIVAGHAKQNQPVARALAHPWLVRVGLISYPLYLWHWPLIAFAHRMNLQPYRTLPALAIIAVTTALSVLTYRYIETPIRKRRALRTSQSLLVAFAVAVVLLAGTGLHFWTTDGAAYRFSPMARALLTSPLMSSSSRCGLTFRVLHPRAQVCPLREESVDHKRVLLWGNSHAGMWASLFTELGATNGASVYLNARNCRATLDNEFCGRQVQREVLSFIDAAGVTDVVLASSWHGSYKIPDESFEASLTNVVQGLVERKVRTWLVIDTPTAADLNPVAAFEKSPEHPQFGSVPTSVHRKLRQKEAALFDQLARTHDGLVTVLDPSYALCDQDICAGGQGTESWYRDADHLTNAGARVARTVFSPIFATAEEEPRRL